MSISLDGFVAGPDQSLDNPLGKRGQELHGWHIGVGDHEECAVLITNSAQVLEAQQDLEQ